MSDFDDLGDEIRRLAIAAGVSPDVLDGPHRCFAGCGAVVTRGSDTCGPCTTRRIDAEHGAALKRAWETVPESLHWATLYGPRVTEWVRDTSAIQKAREAASAADWRPIIVLTGEPGAGKTTLACALMRAFMLPGSRRDASAMARARSRRARFAAAHRLVADKSETRLGEHVVSIDLARGASLLVLDEVGRGVDTHGVIFSLLHERHAERRPTIMTTPFATAQELAAVTDGGLARRVFDDAFVINVRKVPQ